MSDLTQKKCVPCEGGVSCLLDNEIKTLSTEVADWNVTDNKKLNRSFKFKDFLTALAFVNKVGEIAEAEGHHPNICFTWGKVDFEIWTHAIGGLHENDFILAAKINEILPDTEGLKS